MEEENKPWVCYLNSLFFLFLVSFLKLAWDLVRYGEKTAKQHNDSSWKAEFILHR